MDLKEMAAREAVRHVKDGMVVGLGSGSTASIAIRLLGEKVRQGWMIVGVPTSRDSEELGRSVGITIGELKDHHVVDVTIDGADEVDPDLNLIKGLGRALLREKIVEIHARRLLIVVDEGKLSPRLGLKCPLPVEIVPFEPEVQLRWLERLASRAEYYREPDGSVIHTDNGNPLALCWFDGGMPDPAETARRLAERPGIVEHGLFLGMADQVIVAGADGIRILERQK